MSGPSPLRVGFLGAGAAVPASEVTNEELARRGHASDAWIRRRTGVQARHVLRPDESIVDLAAAAGRAAIENAGLRTEDIGEVRIGVCTWMRLPSLASRVQAALDIPEGPSADVAAGCAGFIYAVEDVWNRIQIEELRLGQHLRALVIGVDALSHITDWSKRGTAVLLGDGAGAVVVGKVERGGLLETVTRANGRHAEQLFTKADGDGRQVLHMDGRAVFSAAVETMVADVHRVLARYERVSGVRLSVDEIAYFYPHQANLRILERVAKRLRVPVERVYTRGIVHYGNTSAASIPMGYADPLGGPPRSSEGPHYEIDMAFGAGYASGAILRQVG